LIQGIQVSVCDQRFFMVDRRDRPTLHGIIRREVRPGSTVHTDEWRAYRTLEQYGYIHETVNHSQYFVDPRTGAHTQLIECLWGPLKLKVLKQMRGTTEAMKKRQLVESWWKGLNPQPYRFQQFLDDLRLTYV
jgi:transposase-like protein